MRNVFNSTIAVFFIATVLAAFGCKKDKSSPEDALRISTDAATMALTPGPDFDFNLTVESAMPAAGVRIEFTVKGEADNQNYPQGPAIETTAAITKIKINNLPRQKICVCTVTVTSKGSSTNKTITSFRVAYK